VSLYAHQADNLPKAGKITNLRGYQRVCFEKRNDAVRQIGKPSDVIPPDVLAMIVVSAIYIDRPAPKETFQCVHHMHAPSSLYDRELGLDLPTELARSIPKDRNTETSLTVDETDDPLRSQWPFRLIDRTGHIVTFHVTTPYDEALTTIG
jgi:hypothetical protein